MNANLVQSVCIFGSVARSNADSLSDKDILIVAEDAQVRTELARKWRADGWSVSAYAPNRFLAMIRVGSLFVQHLKYEALILSDNGGWLRKGLSVAAPKTTYLADAHDSISLAMPIERFADDILVSDQPIIADLAFVSFRNFGINYLADRGMLVFDYAQVVNAIGADYGLRPQELDLLHSLRAGKSAYRTSETCASLFGTAEGVRSLLEKLMPCRKLAAINAISGVRRLSSGYARLRDFEAALVSQFGYRPEKKQLKVQGLECVWKWISSPRDYSWQIRNFTQNELIERCPLIRGRLNRGPNGRLAVSSRSASVRDPRFTPSPPAHR